MCRCKGSLKKGEAKVGGVSALVSESAESALSTVL